MKLIFVASSETAAREAQDAGIDRIFFDLEFINKSERQRGRNTLILNNRAEDIPKIRDAIHSSELLVRVNSLHPDSKFEIDKVINYGADIVMLPMVR